MRATVGSGSFFSPRELAFEILPLPNSFARSNPRPNPIERRSQIMVETFQKIGDGLGVVWSLFEDQSGQLTVPAMLLLAALAFATAARSAFATLPALEAKLGSVVAIGSGITVVFGLVGLYFVVQIF